MYAFKFTCFQFLVTQRMLILVHNNLLPFCKKPAYRNIYRFNFNTLKWAKQKKAHAIIIVMKQFYIQLYIKIKYIQSVRQNYSIT